MYDGTVRLRASQQRARKSKRKISKDDTDLGDGSDNEDSGEYKIDKSSKNEQPGNILGTLFAHDSSKVSKIILYIADNI